MWYSQNQLHHTYHLWSTANLIVANSDEIGAFFVWPFSSIAIQFEWNNCPVSSSYFSYLFFYVIWCYIRREVLWLQMKHLCVIALNNMHRLCRSGNNTYKDRNIHTVVMMKCMEGYVSDCVHRKEKERWWDVRLISVTKARHISASGGYQAISGEGKAASCCEREQKTTLLRL